MQNDRSFSYDREKAVEYAHKWAFSRNPLYYNFDLIGGDCTSFISQCLYAGTGVMNFTKDTGWYYSSVSSRAAGWSGVEFLHNFLVKNTGAGPYATEQPITVAQPGDIIQLSFDGVTFGHSLFIVDTGFGDFGDILIATHTDDSDNRPLSSYFFAEYRLLHIEGVRK